MSEHRIPATRVVVETGAGPFERPANQCINATLRYSQLSGQGSVSIPEDLYEQRVAELGEGAQVSLECWTNTVWACAGTVTIGSPRADRGTGYVTIDFTSDGPPERLPPDPQAN